MASVDLIHEDTHSRLTEFSEAIPEAHLTHGEDSRTILFGLGSDPKGILVQQQVYKKNMGYQEYLICH